MLDMARLRIRHFPPVSRNIELLLDFFELFRIKLFEKNRATLNYSKRIGLLETI